VAFQANGGILMGRTKKRYDVKHRCKVCNREIMVVDKILHGGKCVNCFLKKVGLDEKYGDKSE